MAHDAAYNLLMEQFDFRGTFECGSEGQRRFKSAFGFGYIFGFTEALMLIAGITDEPATLAAISVAFTRLFGVDRGSRIVDKCLRIQDEPEFRAARLLGAQEIRAWLAHPDGSDPAQPVSVFAWQADWRWRSGVKLARSARQVV